MVEEEHVAYTEDSEAANTSDSIAPAVAEEEDAQMAAMQFERLRRWSKVIGFEAVPGVAKAALGDHAEKSVVERDVNRSLWRFDFCRKWSEEDREKRRTSLRQVLDACFATLALEDRGYHYYQGFHDVCEVCLAVSGFDEATALGMSLKLAAHHFADATRPDLARVGLALRLIVALVFAVDRTLATAIFGRQSVAREPVWALSWIITWFAHDMDDWEQLLCLWDHIVEARHAAFPLYVAAALVIRSRQCLLDCAVQAGDDLGPMLYLTLSKLPAAERDVEALARSALGLLQAYPPTALWTKLPRLPRDLGRMLEPVKVECALAELYQSESLALVYFVLHALCRRPLALILLAKRNLRNDRHQGVALLGSDDVRNYQKHKLGQHSLLSTWDQNVATLKARLQAKPASMLLAALVAVILGSDFLLQQSDSPPRAILSSPVSLISFVRGLAP